MAQNSASKSLILNDIFAYRVHLRRRILLMECEKPLKLRSELELTDLDERGDSRRGDDERRDHCSGGAIV